MVELGENMPVIYFIFILLILVVMGIIGDIVG
jgi:hypothetical protein